ncbi:MAG TPA: hypothetical protein VD695_00325 [Gaiellaceae bacterium]|nr:hypothetical protein [Gaiellaceae bacterium]
MAIRRIRDIRLRHAGRSRALALVALYTAAAVVATLPASLDVGSAFVANGDEGNGEAAAGDHLQAVYRFWLVGHQLARGTAPWIDPYSFQPLVEPQVVLAGWPFGLAFWPLDAAFGPVVAWNLLLLGIVAAAGLLTYGWLRELALRPAAAALGGLAFALAPYRLAQSGTHLLGWIAVLLPLALFAFERSRRAGSGRGAHLWGALAAAAIVSIPLSGQLHLALGAVPFLAVYAAARAAPVAATWAGAGLAAAVGVGLAVHLAIVRDSAESEGRSLQEVGEYSASLSDLVGRGLPDELERFVYVGWLLPVLAVAGLVLLWQAGQRPLAAVLGAGALVPVLLALGTTIPLYEWLWDVFPPLRFPRVPGRLMPIADLALAALAAVAAARLVAASGRRAAAAAAALLALVAADLLVFPLAASRADPDNAAYAALRDEPDGRVLELPLFEPGIHYGSVYDYYQLQSARERPGGYSTLVPRAAFDFYFLRNRLSCGVWLPGDEETLAAIGVRNVTFHAGAYEQGSVPGAWFGWQKLLEHGFAPEARGGRVTLFTRDGDADLGAPFPEPPRDVPLFCEGWNGRVTDERQGPFWLYGSGPLRLTVSAIAETPVTLWVDGERADVELVDGTGTLEGELAGEGWHALVLEIPDLLGTAPPQGLELEAVAFARR